MSAQSLTIDQCLARTNPFGRYQIFMAFMYAVWQTVLFCNHSFFGFAGIEPYWSCSTHNNTHLNQDCDVFTDCPKNNLTISSHFYSVVQEWHLVCDKSYIPRMMASVLFVGVFIGALFLGFLIDNYGRKRSMIGALAGVGCFGILSAFSLNWQMLTVGLALMGVSMGVLLDVAGIYSSEFTTNRYRLLMATTGGASLFRLSGQALIAYVARDWRRYMIFVNVIPFFGIILTLFFVYESPRWLLQKERISEAEQKMKRIAKFNGSLDKLPRNLEIVHVKNKKVKFYPWDLFRNGSLLGLFTMVGMMAHFEVGFLVATMLLEISKLTSAINAYLSVFLVALLSSLSLLVAVIELKMPNYLNRRLLFILLSAGLTLSTGAIFVLQLVQLGHVLTVFAVICYTLILIKMQCNSTLAVELFPTLLRANVSSLCSGADMLGAIVAPQLLYLAEWWSPMPYLVICLIDFATLIAFFIIYPNTNTMELAQMERFAAADEKQNQFMFNETKPTFLKAISRKEKSVEKGTDINLLAYSASVGEKNDA